MFYHCIGKWHFSPIYNTFVVISRVIMFTASPLLHHLWLSPTHTSHLVKLLHCIHMLCINKECPILLHHMSLSLMLDIFTQCPQCHLCNSGKINRYLLLYINKFLYYFFSSFWWFIIYTCFFRLFQRVCRYPPYRTILHHPKLIKIWSDRMLILIMKCLLMGKLFLETT